MYGLPSPKHWRFNDFDKHLVRNLGRWGYYTVLAGCQHEASFDDLSPLGYDEVLSSRYGRDGEFYPDTIVNVEHFLSRVPDGPFFLSFGIDEPHNDNLARPELGLHGKADRHSKTRFYDPDRLDSRYVAPPGNLPNLPEIRAEIASLGMGVKIMDEYIGRVLFALEHRGLLENSLVIITSDHGVELPGGKMTLGDLGTGVMLFVRGPGGFGGGRVLDGLVSQLDIWPTICEVLGKPAPAWLEGRSLVPLLDGRLRDGDLRDYVFTEQTHHGRSMEPLRAVRSERYKLVLRYYPDGPRMTGPGRSHQLMQELGWNDRSLGHVELFDLFLDPMEACNRAEDPAYRTVRAEHESAVRKWMERTGDPFAAGEIPEPGSLL
jgi:arylsulfatase A-like enzyme